MENSCTQFWNGKKLHKQFYVQWKVNRCTFWFPQPCSTSLATLDILCSPIMLWPHTTDAYDTFRNIALWDHPIFFFSLLSFLSTVFFSPFFSLAEEVLLILYLSLHHNRLTAILWLSSWKGIITQCLSLYSFEAWSPLTFLFLLVIVFYRLLYFFYRARLNITLLTVV